VEVSCLSLRGFQARRLDGLLEHTAKSTSAQSTVAKRPAVFLDRDGTINLDKADVYRPDDFEWLPGAIEAIKRLNDAGIYVFVVTNQSGVARGFYGEAEVAHLHNWMQTKLAAFGAHIDDFRYCPYHPEAEIEAFKADHDWRKPAPGMILDLMAHWPVDSAQSLMIGDRDIDIEAGRAAGIAAQKVDAAGLMPIVSAFLAKLSAV